MFKCARHSDTKQCIDLNIMYSSSTHVITTYRIGQYPLVKRPSRFTTVSATLIDNIFSSELEYKIDSEWYVGKWHH